MVILQGESERSANQDPLPGESRLPKVLINRAKITPATIETAQKAKKTEAVAALSASIRSGAFPAHDEVSIAELAA